MAPIPRSFHRISAHSSSMPKIVIIGAGIGGLSVGIALKRQLRFTDFTIYEKAADVGGTWRDNIYPGASSDAYIHFYSLSTDLEPDWPSTHGSQPDTLAYWRKLAHKYDLYPQIVFNHLVISAEWNAKEEIYNVVTKDGEGRRSSTTAKILISAIGILEVPRFPDISGIASFGGKSFHSAQWDAEVDLRGKRVAVVGNGPSAMQFVPIISQDPTVKVTQFCRTPHWLVPPIRADYSPRWKWAFNYIPLAMRLYRFTLYLRSELFYLLVYHHASLRQPFEKRTTEYIRATAPQSDLAHLIPNYEMGCKRVILDTNFLPSLHRPNMSLNWDGIQSICTEGLITKTGDKLEFDVMIFATGFVADRFPLVIRGAGGRSVQEYYEEQGCPKAYIGTTIPGFPNMFMISGPNTTTGHISVVFTEELQIDYIIKFVKPILGGVVSSFEVTPTATDRYNKRIQEMLSRSVHTSCTSWYRTGGDGPISSIFPGPGILFWWWTRRPQWDDYCVDAASTPRWNSIVRWRKIKMFVFRALYLLLPVWLLVRRSAGLG
ncbi:hypothetical protein B0H17DRAFT_1065875 [Mycena rosella]|uniref:Uncharacterized protein n=1 Tax=Mycena rosella TaxID=1033263 RepID=A0AAD7DF15_MYCRO|nr:hypothetical protein B0H17DRAFT_1065875 [Mycena rosella]